jgi:hypothetical protein
LDNVGERSGYEIPFAQALVARGHRIFFRSTHGQLEQGKDIITADKAGHYHAFQLKAGDLTLKAWRDIHGEVQELVSLPLQHPDIPRGVPFTGHLVTSGLLKDPTRKTIQDWKTKWLEQGHSPLELTDRDALLRMFLDTHGDVLFSTPADLERFLRLFLADKKDVLPREDFAAFIESSLPLDTATLKRSEIKRALASTAILASYILQGYQHSKNHYAVAEGWLMVFAYLLELLESFPAYLKWCRPTLDICISAWETASEDLMREALRSERWLAGDFIPDYAVRGWRTTVVLGQMCSFAIYRRLIGKPLAEEGEILGRAIKEFRHAGFWGEGAGALCYSVVLFLWMHGQEEHACQWCGQLAKELADINGRRQVGPGVPDPYIDARELLGPLHLGEPPLRDTFRGRSFLLPVLVEFLARRGRKRMLTSLWYEVCEVDRSEFTLDHKQDFYRWRAKTGSLDTRRWPHPQPWSELVASAEAEVPRDLILTRDFLPLLMPFLALYPHRFTARMARLVEHSL